MKKKEEHSPIICKNCGGQLEIEHNKEYVECPYCGTTYSVSDLLGESEATRIERIKSNTIKEVETQRSKEAMERERNREISDREEKFKKSKLNKWLIIFAFISGLVCAAKLSKGITLVGVIALVQAVLYSVAWLMGRQIIKEKRRNLHALIVVIALLLNIPFFMLVSKDDSSSVREKGENINWENICMRDSIPTPERTFGIVDVNTERYLYVTLYDYSKDEYQTYLNACIKEGYNVNSETVGECYLAHNPVGYVLNLDYDDDNEEVDIYLEAPVKMEKYHWPDNIPGKLLPKPVSDVGKIELEYDDRFYITVGDTSPEAFKQYVQTVSDSGFNIDYDKGDTYYLADHPDYYHVNLRYIGFDSMEIEVTPIDKPVNSTETTAESTASAETTVEPSTAETVPTTTVTETEPATEPVKLVNGMRPEFKEAMDAYEAFFDEYIEFMTKYEESDNALTMLVEYGDFMLKYADYMEKFEAWDDGTLNDTEMNYYLQVQMRVNQKLLTAISE